jgi:hypothetical protein
VCVERDALLGGRGLCDGHGDTEDGVGTQGGLVRCAIELVKESVYGGLVLDVDVLLDERGGNGVVDVADSLGDTLTAPLGLVSIAEFASLVRAGRGTGGDDGAVKAGLGDNVDLDGRVALESMSATRPMAWKVEGRGLECSNGIIGHP